MPIITDKLQTALSTFDSHEGTISRSGAFEKFYGIIHHHSQPGNSFHHLTRFVSYIIDDLWTLETIILRLQNERKRYEQGELTDVLWMQFASCDVSLFHISLRSIFDYVGSMTKQLSITPGQVPESFEALRTFIQQYPNRTHKIGPAIAKVISSCEWFSDLRHIRDSIVHRGSSTIVFPEKTRILFQVHQGTRNQIIIPELMDNENVVIFELYGGMIMGYTYAFLDNFASAAAPSAGIGILQGGTMRTHPGLATVKDWISATLQLPSITKV